MRTALLVWTVCATRVEEERGKGRGKKEKGQISPLRVRKNIRATIAGRRHQEHGVGHLHKEEAKKKKGCHRRTKTLLAGDTTHLHFYRQEAAITSVHEKKSIFLKLA